MTELGTWYSNWKKKALGLQKLDLQEALSDEPPALSALGAGRAVPHPEHPTWAAPAGAQGSRGCGTAGLGTQLQVCKLKGADLCLLKTRLLSYSPQTIMRLGTSQLPHFSQCSLFSHEIQELGSLNSCSHTLKVWNSLVPSLFDACFWQQTSSIPFILNLDHAC